jgi:lipoate-protein ligase A
MRRPPKLTDPAALALLDRMTAREWRVIRSGPGSAVWNMAVDEALLAAAGAGSAAPTLRFYSWDPPAVSLGRFQDDAGVNVRYAQGRGWDVVRRPTGGRGVLHQFELTYSVTLPPPVLAGAGVRAGYAVLVELLNCGLRTLLGEAVGAPADDAPPRCATGSARAANCFALSAECDTLVPGGKLVGSAQVRKGGALLQHGSILLDVETAAWTALFGEAGRPMTLQRLLGRIPPLEEVEAALLAGFASMGVLWRADGGVGSRETWEAS